MKYHLPITLCALGMFLALTAPQSSFAYTFIEYDETYTSGSVDPTEATPWLTALFENPDDGISGYSFDKGVLLTLSAPNLSATEFVSNWYFNFNPLKDLDGLIFTFLDGVSTTASDSDDYVSEKGFKAGAGLTFNVNIPYPTANKNRFGDNGVSRILITSVGFDIFDQDFNTPVYKHDAEFISVAHIQGINSQDSAWVKGYDPPMPTPEPAGVILLGMGILGMLIMGKALRPGLNKS